MILEKLSKGDLILSTRAYLSRNDLIKSSIAAAGPMVKEQVERLLAGGAIEQTINEHMVFGDLKTNSDALLSLLLFSGYLTAVKTDLLMLRSL